MDLDNFDRIDMRYRAITAQNCKSKPASELRLPYGSVGQLPKFNRLLSHIVYPNRTKLLHVHNMALNRAFFFRYSSDLVLLRYEHLFLAFSILQIVGTLFTGSLVSDQYRVHIDHVVSGSHLGQAVYAFFSVQLFVSRSS